MTDLLLLWSCFLIPILWLFSRNRRWFSACSLLGGALLIFLHPLLFNSRIARVCESDLFQFPSESTWIPMGATSYFSWREKLEDTGAIQLREGMQEPKALSPRARDIPWWYPDTDGDELELSGGLAYHCAAPVGFESFAPARLHQFTGFPLRVDSVGGIAIHSKEEGRREIRRQSSKLPVKLTLFRRSMRITIPLPFTDLPTGAENAIGQLALQANAVPSYEASFGSGGVITEIGREKSYSVLALLSQPRGAAETYKNASGEAVTLPAIGTDRPWLSRKIQAYALGFIEGPRVFRLSPLPALRASLATLYRMAGLHGHGSLRFLLRNFEAAPGAWYLLPLPSPIPVEFVLFRLACLFLAVGILTLPWLCLPRWIGKIPFPVCLFLLFCLTLLLMANDTWVVVSY